ncbi:MAG TPA: hypothetical protein VER14_07750 [Phototrophicaceae bacterium]|nr:hypothetical protein [Phototrophicaceae bacterium]
MANRNWNTTRGIFPCLLLFSIVMQEGKTGLNDEKYGGNFLGLLVAHRFRFRVMWIWLWNGIAGGRFRWRAWIAHFKHLHITKHQTIYFVFPFRFLITMPQQSLLRICNPLAKGKGLG